jgi:hypothetical protein
MCLIHHDDVVTLRRQQRCVVLAPRRRHRRDHPGLRPERGGIVTQQLVMRGGAVDGEFLGHFLAPLADQRGRRQDQHSLCHAAQHVFLHHHAGFDGLAQADLVGQQHAAAILLQHLAHGFDLVPMGLHAAQRRQAEQFVEPLEQAKLDKLTAQPEPVGLG